MSRVRPGPGGTGVKRLLTIITVGLLLASACGGSTTTNGSAQAAEPTTTDAPEDTAEVQVPTPTATAPPPEPTPAPAPPSISTVLSDLPQAGGWLVPPGQWSTTAFGEPATFATATEMLLIRESEGALWLRPLGVRPTSVLALASTAFVNSGGPTAPQLPPPRTPEDVTAAFENGVFSTLLEEGVSEVDGRDLYWWDFLLDDTSGSGPWLCREGVTCLMTGQSVGGERIIVPTSTRLRLYVPFIEDLRVGAWLIADNDRDLEALAGLAEDLLAGLAPEPGLVAAAPTRSLTIEGVETTSLPSGHTVTMVGDAVVELELQGAVPDIGLDAAYESSLIFSTPSGYVAFFEATAVFPGDIDVQATEQTAWRAWDLTSLDDIASFDAWTEDALGVTARGIDTAIAEFEAPWVDFTVKDQTNSFPCSVSAGKQCSLLTASALGGWAYAAGDGNRLYYLEDAGLIVHIEALTGTTQDVLDEMAPVLNQLTITPIG